MEGLRPTGPPKATGKNLLILHAIPEPRVCPPGVAPGPSSHRFKERPATHVQCKLTSVPRDSRFFPSNPLPGRLGCRMRRRNYLLWSRRDRPRPPSTATPHTSRNSRAFAQKPSSSTYRGLQRTPTLAAQHSTAQHGPQLSYSEELREEALSCDQAHALPRLRLLNDKNVTEPGEKEPWAGDGKRETSRASLSFYREKPGESANAVPHYHKLCSRVSHIWGNRRGQHIRSAMDKPRPGKTTFVIMVSPLPGKYELLPAPTHTPSRSPHSLHTVTSRPPPPHPASPRHPRGHLRSPHAPPPAPSSRPTRAPRAPALPDQRPLRARSSAYATPPS